MANDRYLGKGIIFPVQLTPQGLPVISSGTDLIKSSIKMILGWRFKTRILKSAFGSRNEELLEEPNDDLLKGLLKFFVYDALIRWEKRIDVVSIELTRTSYEKLDCELTYKVKTSGLEDVLTFPFYTRTLS